MTAKTEFMSHHFSSQGYADGGCCYGAGFAISWQRGSLHDSSKPNGAFVEDLIEACVDRLEYEQNRDSSSSENAQALVHLKQAINALHLKRDKDKGFNK